MTGGVFERQYRASLHAVKWINEISKCLAQFCHVLLILLYLGWPEVLHLDLSKCPLLHKSLLPPGITTVRVVIPPESSGWMCL